MTIPLEYIGPGLATGNAVIVKPPIHTPWALLELAKAFDEAGVPPGAVSIIPGAAEIGDALRLTPDLDPSFPWPWPPRFELWAPRRGSRSH